MADPTPKKIDALKLFMLLAAELPSLISSVLAVIESEKAAGTMLDRVKIAEPVVEAAASLADKIIEQLA